MSVPLPVFSASTSAVKLATPASVCTTTSASISADLTGSCATASATPVKRSVQSRPLRVSSLTAPFSMRTCTR